MNTTETVDWEAQWSLFAPGFQNGLAHIELEKNIILRLVPGAGFGDLSHPTTRLMIALLKPHIKNKFVIDIGCGSGILSLSALLLGAQECLGIDIEQEALDHATANAKLNALEEKCSFIKPEKLAFFSAKPLLLMNMIQSEQKVAWKSFCEHANSNNGEIITSGILTTQKESYLALTRSWGWSLIEEQFEEEWSAFRFQTG